MSWELGLVTRREYPSWSPSNQKVHIPECILVGSLWAGVPRQNPQQLSLCLKGPVVRRDVIMGPALLRVYVASTLLLSSCWKSPIPVSICQVSQISGSVTGSDVVLWETGNTIFTIPFFILATCNNRGLLLSSTLFGHELSGSCEGCSFCMLLWRCFLHLWLSQGKAYWFESLLRLVRPCLSRAKRWIFLHWLQLK